MANTIPLFAEDIIKNVATINNLNPKILRQLIVNNTIYISTSDPDTYEAILNKAAENVYNSASNGESVGGYQPSEILASSNKLDSIFYDLYGRAINSEETRLDYNSVKTELLNYPLLLIIWGISGYLAFKALNKLANKSPDLSLPSVDIKPILKTTSEFLK